MSHSKQRFLGEREKRTVHRIERPLPESESRTARFHLNIIITVTFKFKFHLRSQPFDPDQHPVIIFFRSFLGFLLAHVIRDLLNLVANTNKRVGNLIPRSLPFLIATINHGKSPFHGNNLIHDLAFIHSFNRQVDRTKCRRRTDIGDHAFQLHPRVGNYQKFRRGCRHLDRRRFQ